MGAKVKRLLGVPLLAGAVVLVPSVVLPHQAPVAHADVIGVGADQLGTSWYGTQTGLSPALVSGGTFGKEWDHPVNGSVYAQPLAVGGTLIVATENNQVYGINRLTGAEQWHRSDLGPPFDPTAVACADLTPNIGITGTPVVDPATNTAYLVAKTMTPGDPASTALKMHALNVTTGAEKAGFPVTLGGVASGRTFDAKVQMQRPGLLLMGGVVYAAFGGHCDFGNYTGWVMGVTTAGVITSRWVTETNAGSAGAGIWQSGGGLVSDGPGRILLATGNGPAPTSPTPGSTPPGRLGEAVVRLQVAADKSLHAVDFFAPYDSETLNGWDADLGSGAPVALPASFGTASNPHLMVEIGKQGYLYVLDRDNLGGFMQGLAGADAVLDRTGQWGGVWGKPAVWPGDGGYIWLVTASGGGSAGATTGFLRAFKAGTTAAGKRTFALTGTSPDGFGFSSGSPIVTSNGTSSGSALVWVVWSPQGNGVGAQLRAYDAVPAADGSPHLRFSAPIGTASKFSMPIATGNKIYVGTRDGHVMGFGSPIASPMTTPAVSFAPTTVGAARQQIVQLTANFPLTVTNVASSNPVFAPGASSPVLPATLAAGAQFNVPVTFTPTSTGPQSGTLTVSTSSGPVQLSMTGDGQSATADLRAAPSTISFGGVALGRPPAATTVTFSNLGATSLTVGGATLPEAPFTATGLPPNGFVIGPGAAVSATVTFDPTSAGLFTSILTLTTSAGDIEVPMSGSAADPPVLTLSASSVSAGNVPVGSQVTRSITLSNTGGSVLTFTKSKPPAAGKGFAATSSIPEGSSLAPGESTTARVVFAPTRTDPASDVWVVSGDDGAGARSLTFTGRGVDSVGVPAIGTGGWLMNGAAIAGPRAGSVRLTTFGQTGSAGSAFYPTAVSSSYLDISFDSSITGDADSGADGVTLTLLDGTADPHGVGSTGGGLGFASLPGTAVTLDTWQGPGDPGPNFLGVTPRVPAGASVGYTATATNVPPLRGNHRVRAIVEGGRLTAFVDGAAVLTTTVLLPPTVYIGFTASTGGFTDTHDVSNLTVLRPWTLPGKPTGLVASGSSQGTRVAWNPVPDGGYPISTYDLVVQPGSTHVSVLGRYTSVLLPNLVAGQTYTFTLQARNANGLGPVSSPSVPYKVLDTVAPGRPIAVYATALGGGAVRLNWARPLDRDIAKSQVFMALGAVPPALTGTPLYSGTSYTYTKTGLSAGRVYTFSVRICDTSNNCGLPRSVTVAAT